MLKGKFCVCFCQYCFTNICLPFERVALCHVLIWTINSFDKISISYFIKGCYHHQETVILILYPRRVCKILITLYRKIS